MSAKKAAFLISLVLLGMVANASAAQVWFYGGGQSSGIWNNSSNWYGGVPTSADHADLNSGGITCIVDANHTGGSAAKCSRLTLPDWENAGDTNDYCFLDMTGGTITVGGNFEMGRWGGGSAPYDRGMFNISGGTVTAGGYMSIGESGEGVVNMTGGVISVTGTLYVPKTSAGTGTLNLVAGTISADGISMSSNGLVDINDGTLILSGNKTESVNDYIGYGWITANDVSEQVLVDYNMVTGKTTVTAGKVPGLIDDFESYTDGNDLRLVWTDGNDSNNGTGSLVYLDTDMRHGGTKSMKYQYDNGSWPYCSEVYRAYQTAGDWTEGGAKFLTLFFHGDVNNEAEQMYVVLQDDNDANSTVLYDGDANDLLQQEAEYWNVWNIRLSDFNNGGVDLSCVQKITIGFDGSGGTGTVYFDDIKLSSYRCAPDYDYLSSSDFTRDAAVNLLDYAELANAWMNDSNDYDFDEIYDLDSNNVIETGDLGLFVSDWLWPDEQVQITVDACDIKGDISTMLTGVNMAWYYDSDDVWADGSIAGYLRDVNAGILRYPGGCETSVFHWKYPYGYPGPCGSFDFMDPEIDPNDYPPDEQFMDTDDYIQQCNAIGAKPMLGVNIQSGVRFDRLAESVNEAVEWVTYCNVTHDYNVVYWYMDNEPYYNSNCDGITVEDYAYYIKQFVPAMRAVDANIKIIVNWENKLGVESYWNDWEYLIEEANEYIDIADLHWYWAWGYCTWDLWLSDNPMISREWCGDCPGSRYYGPNYVEEIQQFHEKIKDVNGASYDIKLAALEWNIAPNDNFTFSRFQHALMHAEMLGQFIEGGLYMATMWPLHWGGGMGNNFRAIVDQENHKPTPSFYVFKLYSNVLGQQLIASQTSRVDIRPVCALSQDGNTLWVFLLNKSADGQAVNAVLDIGGFSPAGAEAIALTAPELSSDVGKLQKLKVKINSETGKWESVLPPYSLTMLTLRK
jgi:alpha-N-arabinofuranosidase